jgi:hypothetical protein
MFHHRLRRRHHHLDILDDAIVSQHGWPDCSQMALAAKYVNQAMEAFTGFYLLSPLSLSSSDNNVLQRDDNQGGLPSFEILQRGQGILSLAAEMLMLFWEL